jgi:hypothetical protein
MGACYNDMTLDGKLSKEEVAAEFNDKCRQAGYDSGRGGYSGSFYEFSGLVFHDNEFDTRDEAYMYVTEHAQKWGAAVCVRFKNTKPSKMVLNHDKARAKLQRKIWLAEAYLGDANRKAQINNRSTKPAYVTKTEERLAKVKERVQPKIDARTEKITAILKALSAKTKDVHWYLGGWCSS